MHNLTHQWYLGNGDVKQQLRRRHSLGGISYLNFLATVSGDNALEVGYCVDCVESEKEKEIQSCDP